MRASRVVATAVAIGVSVATCSPTTDTVLEVVSIRPGEDVVDRRRFEPTIWYPLAVARISDPQADEILTAHAEGLSAVRNDGSIRRLWSGHDVKAAAWTPETGEHAQLVFVIDGIESQVLHALDCSSDHNPCDEVDNVTASGGESSLATADMNEDGIVDILSWGDDIVGIRLGSTAGGQLHWESRGMFGPTPSWLDDPGPRLAAVDLDDDGHVDVACVVQPSGARVFFGDGAGGSNAFVNLMGGSFEVQVGDLDNDGLPDVLTDEALFVNLGDRSFERIELPSDLGSITTIGRFAPGGLQLLTITLVTPGTGGALHTLSPELEWTARELTVPVEEDAEFSFDEAWVVGDLDGDGTDELVAGTDVPPRDGCG